MVKMRNPEKRHRILKEALEVFAEKGYHAASVDEIAQKSTISKGGLYFYFPSKEDLFVSLIREFGERIIERIYRYSEEGRTGIERLERALDKTIQIFSKYSALARFLLIEAASSNPRFERERQAVLGKLETIIAAYIDECVRDYNMSLDVESRTIAALWIGGVYHLIISALTEGNPEGLAEKTKIVKKVLIENFFREVESGKKAD
jgi:AcrR family transcriptional regulator